MQEADGVALVHQNVNRMATLSADEASHWDMLHAGWSVDRTNHSVTSSDHGKHTNWAESYFSRLRRMVVGQHHHVSPQYLHQFANQAAWLEDNRGTSNGGLAFGWWPTPWVARCRGLGRATGSGRREFEYRM